jgi:hypothetical protein
VNKILNKELSGKNLPGDEIASDEITGKDIFYANNFTMGKD